LARLKEESWEIKLPSGLIPAVITGLTNPGALLEDRAFPVYAPSLTIKRIKGSKRMNSKTRFEGWEE
jgi:hypothetical protein